MSAKPTRLRRPFMMPIGVLNRLRSTECYENSVAVYRDPSDPGIGPFPIHRILRALGWDRRTISEDVCRSKTLECHGGFADYAFFVPGHKDPVMIVEAKAIHDSDIAYALGEMQDDPEDEGGAWGRMGARKHRPTKRVCCRTKAGLRCPDRWHCMVHLGYQ